MQNNYSNYSSHKTFPISAVVSFVLFLQLAAFLKYLV